MAAETCGTCRFVKRGECHRNAPRPLGTSLDPVGPLWAWWPVVDPLDWCGEWKQEDAPFNG